VVGQLDDLDEPAVWRDAAEDHARFAHGFTVLVVELEAVAMALVNHLLAVGLVGERAGEQLARVESQPHRAAHLVHVSLLGH
jgi:hypothetical protein